MHQLKNTWVLFEHQNTNLNYEQNTRELGKFNTVEQFWQYFNNYPVPSKLFYQNNYKPKLAKPTREISSISMFKENIFPKWEDPMNNKGGDLAIRSFTSMEQIDQIWETIAILCIGNLFEYNDIINGIRVVDSSIPNKKKLYRVELWFRDKTKKDLIEKDLKNKLNIEIELFYKEHSTAVESTPYKYKRYNNNNYQKKRNYGFKQ